VPRAGVSYIRLYFDKVAGCVVSAYSLHRPFNVGYTSRRDTFSTPSCSLPITGHPSSRSTTSMSLRASGPPTCGRYLLHHQPGQLNMSFIGHLHSKQLGVETSTAKTLRHRPMPSFRTLARCVCCYAGLGSEHYTNVRSAPAIRLADIRIDGVWHPCRQSRRRSDDL